ncbi:UNVERIFIED_CONTAM: uri1, prefoldin-like chaperone [Siphonaria sp. JEL0065]|nr:uri1, prefoldin-like chaperone [Siphonaria sp. JEL0065]
MQLIVTAEREAGHYTQYSKEYGQLEAFLTTAPLTTTIEHRVPVGRFAFLEGRLVHTNEVLVSLGDNWFVDRSAAQAKDIARRRREYADQNAATKQDELMQLKLRLELTNESASAEGSLASRLVDKDGDELNEEGLKFVEIREEEDEHGNITLDQKVLGNPSTVPTHPQKSASNPSKSIINTIDSKTLSEPKKPVANPPPKPIPSKPRTATTTVTSKTMEAKPKPGNKSALVAANTSKSAAVVVSKSSNSSKSIPSAQKGPKSKPALGSFELEFLKKLEAMERQEEEGIVPTENMDPDNSAIPSDNLGYEVPADSDGEEDEKEDGQDDDDEYEKGLQEFSSGIHEDDDDDDFNDGVVFVPIEKKETSGGKSDDDDDGEEYEDDDEESIDDGDSDQERDHRQRQQPNIAIHKTAPTETRPTKSASVVVENSTQTVASSPTSISSNLPPINNPGDIYIRMKFVADAAAAVVIPTSKAASVTSSKPSTLAVAKPTKTTITKPAPPSKTTIPPETSIFLQDKIQEHVNSDDEDLESIGSEDIEDFLLGREIAKEYHERRRVLLAQQEKILDKMSDEVKEQVELAEENRTKSRFRSQRIGFPSESLKHEITEYIETQKREEAIARDEEKRFGVPGNSPSIVAPTDKASTHPPATTSLKSSLTSPTADALAQSSSAVSSSNGAKPKFKPIVKPKKSVSFSEEALDSPSAKDESIPSSPYNFKGVSSSSSPSPASAAKTAAPPVPKEEPVVQLPRVSKFKASRQAAGSVGAMVTQPAPVKVPVLVKESTSAAKPVSAIVSEKVIPLPNESVKNVLLEKSPVPTTSTTTNSNGSTVYKANEQDEIIIHHRPVAEVVMERAVPTQQPTRTGDGPVVVKKKSLFRTMREGTH